LNLHVVLGLHDCSVSCVCVPRLFFFGAAPPRARDRRGVGVVSRQRVDLGHLLRGHGILVHFLLFIHTQKA
jgi:hypothetical protein